MRPTTLLVLPILLLLLGTETTALLDDLKDLLTDRYVRLQHYFRGSDVIDEEKFSSRGNEPRNSEPELLATTTCDDSSRSTPELIALAGYPAESHTVVTEDGYMLTVHRIPFSKKSGEAVVSNKTVLLHHGLLGSSADWVFAGPGHSLAYLLSDAGYDVWLANVRGNTYSRAHLTLAIDDPKFWNFTFHEVSQRDLPAVIDYISFVKNYSTTIDYVGHSMGTTVLFALLSTRPQYNSVLRAGVALAPVAFMTHIKSPLRYLAPFSQDLVFLMRLFGPNEFLPQSLMLKWLARTMCELNRYETAICENLIFVMCGYDQGQFNQTLLPAILGHLPAGASTKTLVHYAQLIRSKRFHMFDYGAKGNIKAYGSERAPDYAVENITLPIALISAQNDWLSSLNDTAKLYSKLQHPMESYVVPLKDFNHIDFLWAIDAPRLVYSKVLQLLQRKDNQFDRYSYEIN